MSVTHTHHHHHHHHRYCHDNGDYRQVGLCHVGDIYTSHRRRRSDAASASAADKDTDEDSDDLQQAADSVAVQQEWAADVTLVLARNLYTVKQIKYTVRQQCTLPVKQSKPTYPINYTFPKAIP